MRSALIIVGTLSGLVAGVAVGMLTAPCKGAETRKKVADSADNLRKVIQGFTTKRGHSVEDVKNILSEEIQGLQPDVKNKILQIIESAQQQRY
jgi:gas vesicle protein